MKVKVGFHYMSERRWWELNHEMNQDKFLRPSKRLINVGSVIDPDIPSDLPSWAHDGYIFAFPDKEAPGPWSTYEHGMQEWRRLMGSLGEKVIVTRFDVRGGFVVDRAPFADFQYDQSPYNKEAYQQALRAYAMSRVKADRYKGNFRMPELIMKKPIPLERLVLHQVLKRAIIGEGDQRRVVYVPG